jgi:hypothetical protein
MKAIVFLSACALLMTACNGSDSLTFPEPDAAQGASSSSGQGTSSSGGQGGSGGGGAGGEWVTLLKGQWELAPGEETYKCVRKTLEQDLYITAFRALSPLGTHHTVLAVGDPSGPDGIGPCGGTGFGMNMIFGSGVGTGEVHFPDGLSLRVPAGQQLVADLHLFNTAADPLLGESGNEALLTTADAAGELVDNMLAGPAFLYLPPNQQSVVTGNCTMDADVSIVAVQPHMHWLGIHMKVVAKKATGDVVLHDGDFNFDSQIYYPVSPEVSLAKGEKLHVECTFNNTTSATVTFGESTTDEMCLASVYRYPASGAAHTICAY